MRIKSLDLSWFRGAASSAKLVPDCKSMVVYGTNGSGKSSFVDAVEYVVSNKSIAHLKNEYSGSNQVKAISNTKKPKEINSRVEIQFKDNSKVEVDFASNGSSNISGADNVGINEWEYRQTILRQDEVSRFVYSTKGEKYSTLLPLFGLHSLEFAAENLRQIAKTIETESNLSSKKAKVDLINDQRQKEFGNQSTEEIHEIINNLFLQNDGNVQSGGNLLFRCNQTTAALDCRIKESSAEDRKYVLLKQIANLEIASRVDKVRGLAVEIAKKMVPNIGRRLEVLRSASVIVEATQESETMECPACGQTVHIETIRDHLEAEIDQLQEISNIYDSYRSAAGLMTNALISLEAALRNADLEGWQENLRKSDISDVMICLDSMDWDLLRESCTLEALESIESRLLPIVAEAEADSENSPQGVQELIAEKKKIEVATSIVASDGLQSDIAQTEALISSVQSLEKGVRLHIRQKCQSVIDSISSDIEAMWETLHPDLKIEGIRLFLPPSADKAVDVILKFHGLDQESPRLTLSEGYRNSLGLCIFLAMAKQAQDSDRPLFLDDVVVSLDRNHRGMIRELLENEFNDRQVVIFTHDREWYTELRQQLGNHGSWIFRTLLPYETPDVGIRWSHKTTTFDDARAQLKERPDVAGSDARKIMDSELPLIAEKLRSRLPYLRSDKNDMRMAHEFLVRIIADGKKCFEIKSESTFLVHNDAIGILESANQLLGSWGNNAAHSFDVVRPEATKLIEACEAAIECFRCTSCDQNVWSSENIQSKWVQCYCGKIRWRYGKA